MKPISLTITLHSDWHIGSGLEGGAYADALVIKDRQQLPYIPGKSIKGLFKEALTVAFENNWIHVEGFTPENWLASLLGEEGAGLGTEGAISFTNAELTPDEQHYFNRNPATKKHLYQVLHSTAIDSETGVAKRTSLRGIEVVRPLVLHGSVLIDKNGSLVDGWPVEKWIAEVCPLIMSVGGKRQRGLGQASFQVSV